MAEQELQWCKFPRTAIYDPVLSFIAKKIRPELKHAVVSVYTALYCRADTNGLCIIKDLEVFADMCLLEYAELKEIIDKFLEKGVLEYFPDLEEKEFVYKVTSYILPYTASAPDKKPPVASSRQQNYRTRLQRQIAKKDQEQPAVSGLTQEIMAIAAAAGAEDQDSTHEEAKELPDNEIRQNDKNQKNGVTREKRHDEKSKIVVTPQDRHDKKTVNVVTPAKRHDEKSKIVVTPEREREEREREEREIQKDPERTEEEKTTHTQERIPHTPAAYAGLRPDSGGDGVMQEEEGKPGDDTGQMSEKSGDTDGTPEIIPTETGQAAVIPQSDGTPLQSSGNEKGRDIDRGGNFTPEPRELEVSPAELEPTWKALYKYFGKNNPGGYPEPSKENEAITQLAIRLYPLGSEKNPPNIVACNFVGKFANLISKGGYFQGMPCTPQMLLKPGNYAKVFAQVQDILLPKGEKRPSWMQEWEKTVEDVRKEQEIHNPEEATALLYEEHGISADDPNRVMKLIAEKRRQGT